MVSTSVLHLIQQLLCEFMPHFCKEPYESATPYGHMELLTECDLGFFDLQSSNVAFGGLAGHMPQVLPNVVGGGQKQEDSAFPSYPPSICKEGSRKQPT